MSPLALVTLDLLMARTSGSPEIRIGLIDGPVAAQHPALASESVRWLGPSGRAECAGSDASACAHGTFVAGILSARRGSGAPAICPDCTLLARPIFSDTRAHLERPTATPVDLADAMVECIDAGARIINLSLALRGSTGEGVRQLMEALNLALRRNVIVVAAAGNDGSIGSSPITAHSGVIPAVACDVRGAPIRESNLGRSIGRHGIRAPGDGVVSLGQNGTSPSLKGTSIASAFLTGAIALLWSEFPRASSSAIKLAVTQGCQSRRRSVVPPLLDAWSAFQTLARA